MNSYVHHKILHSETKIIVGVSHILSQAVRVAKLLNDRTGQSASPKGLLELRDVRSDDEFFSE